VTTSVEVIYRAIQENTFPGLSVDDMCHQLKTSHAQLRKHIQHKRGEQYPVTLGMIQEILVSGLTPSEATRQYYLSQKDVQRVFYVGTPARDQVDKTLVMRKIQEGWSNQEIADICKCTAARISQIRQELSPRKRRHRSKKITLELRERVREYLQTHDVKETIAHFKLSQATIYKIRKGD
jgi:hypothetical protein